MALISFDGDLLEPFIDGNYHINIDKLPRNVMVEALKSLGHKIVENYVYGVKMVSQKNQDMFGANTLEVGKTYEYDEGESEHSKFNLYADHTAGLWSFGCIKNSISKMQNPDQKYILVKYPIEDVMPIHDFLKGRKMTVVSMDPNDVSIYMKKED